MTGKDSADSKHVNIISYDLLKKLGDELAVGGQAKLRKRAHHAVIYGAHL